jgi:hypothetical protein
MPKERNKADGYREKAPIKRGKSDACIDSSNTAPDDLLQELTRNSYEIVKAKYTKK